MTLHKALHSKQYKELTVKLLDNGKVFIELKRKFHVPLKEPIYNGTFALSYVKRVYKNLNLTFNPTTSC